MALTDNIAKMAGTVLAIAKCRAELAALEFEDEWKRLLGYFLFSLAAFFCLFFGVLMVAILVIVLCWDTCRIPAIIGVAACFLIAGVIIALSVKRSINNKPRMLDLTRQEFARDIARLKASNSTEPQEQEN